MSTTPDPARRRRHGRPSFSGRGARARSFVRRGYAVELATDMRAEQYGGDFPGARHSPHSLGHDDRAALPSPWPQTFSRLGLGFAGALRLLLEGSSPAR